MSGTAAIVVLTPSEGKRLIAKAVAALPEVQIARHSGRIVIAGGTTNAYVAEELTGRTIPKLGYTVGVVRNGQFDNTEPEVRVSPIALERGEISERNWTEIIMEFGPEDVFIKGANAFDLQGMAGVALSQPEGGTCGRAMGIVHARGSHLVIPVGREKLIPSVPDAVKAMGIGRLKFSAGCKTGMYPLVGGRIVSEVEAIQILFPVKAVQVSGGGVAGSEGSTGIVISGVETDVERAFSFLQSIKGEPPVS